jgi:hypothetical protein
MPEVIEEPSGEERHCTACLVAVEICIEPERPNIPAVMTIVEYQIARAISPSHCERVSTGCWM